VLPPMLLGFATLFEMEPTPKIRSWSAPVPPVGRWFHGRRRLGRYRQEDPS